MLWLYIGLVFSFAFRRTTPAIDGLQIIAASALPAVAKLMGAKLPGSATADAFAYIGYAAVAFVILRLICAPYFIWRDQVGELGALKMELSTPERVELERMARIRAKKRLQLAGALREMQVHVFMEGADDATFDKLHRRIAKLAAFCQCGPTAHWAIGAFQNTVDDYRTGLRNDVDDCLSAYVAGLAEYLHGRITDEALETRLPPYTELEKQQ